MATQFSLACRNDGCLCVIPMPFDKIDHYNNNDDDGVEYTEH